MPGPYCEASHTAPNLGDPPLLFGAGWETAASAWLSSGQSCSLDEKPLHFEHPKPLRVEQKSPCALNKKSTAKFPKNLAIPTNSNNPQAHKFERDQTASLAVFCSVLRSSSTGVGDGAHLPHGSWLWAKHPTSYKREEQDIQHRIICLKTQIVSSHKNLCQRHHFTLRLRILCMLASAPARNTPFHLQSWSLLTQRFWRMLLHHGSAKNVAAYTRKQFKFREKE